MIWSHKVKNARTINIKVYNYIMNPIQKVELQYTEQYSLYISKIEEKIFFFICGNIHSLITSTHIYQPGISRSKWPGSDDWNILFFNTITCLL